MNVYRVPAREVLEVEPDPFPTVACADCGGPSLAGASRCERCSAEVLVALERLIGPVDVEELRRVLALPGD